VDYLIRVRDTGESMLMSEEDWRYLLMLAGSFGWSPVAELSHYLSVPPPDVIAGSETRYLADILSKVLPRLPESSRPINVAQPREGVSFMDLRNYFGGQQVRTLEEFIHLCRQGDLTGRRAPEHGP
jgi:hypothetical protein